MHVERQAVSHAAAVSVWVRMTRLLVLLVLLVKLINTTMTTS